MKQTTRISWWVATLPMLVVVGASGCSNDDKAGAVSEDVATLAEVAGDGQAASDAAGGCALDAPGLQGASADVLDSNLRGDDAHAGGKFELSDQDISDLEAYVASL